MGILLFFLHLHYTIDTLKTE